MDFGCSLLSRLEVGLASTLYPPFGPFFALLGLDRSMVL